LIVIILVNSTLKGGVRVKMYLNRKESEKLRTFNSFQNKIILLQLQTDDLGQNVEQIIQSKPD